ncbi:hypothetical protein [Aquimarina spinulae]|uniref:hypothetical protein n=1 Tax=Aquimarina spinulae TaxID=1192023 RepID=UPI000D553A07|nr:hypothetical protein [Aquimarina spinulae]
MNFRDHHLLHLFLGVLLCNIVYSQQLPVEVTPQLIPPYNFRLSDYEAITTEKLIVNLHLTDINTFNRQVRLKLFIENNAGLSIQSSDVVLGAAPIFLDGGVSLRLSNLDLRPYFSLQNLRGVTPQQYNTPLPEGLYRFCFEVYDIKSGQQLSRKSCVAAYLLLNDPPFLNLPKRDEQVVIRDPQNIIFQWTPRHLNATNVEYEFTLSELWDNGMNPQAAFLASRPIYQTTTYATTTLYGPGETMLLPDKKYGWRVRAIVSDGITKSAVFKNDGYSEIFHFTYAGDCVAPQFIMAKGVSPVQEKITWQGVQHKQYIVEYRKKDVENAVWFGSERPILEEETTIYKLTPGTTYEFRVGGQCQENGPYTYSQIYEFTTQIEDGESTYNCGITPEIKIENQNPLPELVPGDTFTAGDFPVLVHEVSSSKGNFTGMGWIKIPYLNDISVGVVFKGIAINTDYELIKGMVETTYDVTWSNVDDIGDEIGVIKEITSVLSDKLNALIVMVKEEIDLAVQTGLAQEMIQGWIDEMDLTDEQREVMGIFKADIKENIKKIREDIANGVYDEEIKNNLIDTFIEEEVEVKETPYYVAEVKSSTNKSKSFFPIVGDPKSAKKYKFNETVFSVRQREPMQLSINTIEDAASFSDPVWFIDKKEIGAGEIVSLDRRELKRNAKIVIRDRKNPENEFQFRITIYEKPIATFELVTNKDDFKGEFLFDDASKKILQRAGDYMEIGKEIFHKKYALGNKKYHVPVLGVKKDQTVTLKIKLTKVKKKGPDFRIKLKSTNPSKIKINGDDMHEITSNAVIDISVKEILNEDEYINVYDHSEGLIGKLRIVCKPIKNENLKIVFIEDKTGQIIADISEEEIFSALNMNGHNQLFRKWITRESDTISINTLVEEYLKIDLREDKQKVEKEMMENVKYIGKAYGWYKKIVIGSQDYSILFVSNHEPLKKETIKTGNGVKIEKKVQGVNMLSKKITLVHKHYTTKHVIHELGHQLGLPHTFCHEKESSDKNCQELIIIKNREIPKYDAKYNFMDYLRNDMVVDTRNMFFTYQMEEINSRD